MRRVLCRCCSQTGEHLLCPVLASPASPTHPSPQSHNRTRSCSPTHNRTRNGTMKQRQWGGNPSKSHSTSPPKTTVHCNTRGGLSGPAPPNRNHNRPNQPHKLNCPPHEAYLQTTQTRPENKCCGKEPCAAKQLRQSPRTDRLEQLQRKMTSPTREHHFRFTYDFQVHK